MSNINESELVYLNGIDATTGEPLINSVDPATGKPFVNPIVDPQTKMPAPDAVGAISLTQAAELITGQERDTAKESWLRRIWRIVSETHLGLPFDVNPELVEQAGWAIVFHEQEDQAIKDALQPLIDHRRQKINKDTIVKVLEYRDGEDKDKWLARHGVGSGSVVPEKVPYYVLLVGGPKRMPFSFCNQLDVEYAVGVLHFDTPDDYQRYVESVINYETGSSVPNTREVTYFATRHKFDRATQLSADALVKPLAEGGGAAASPQGIAQRMKFGTRLFWGEDAKKDALGGIFRPAAGQGTPAVLFTATHGMGFPKGDAGQAAGQGALLCQDWPGYKTISPTHYFTASDVPDDASVHGLIAFFFACYGMGTPQFDRFIHKHGTPPPEIAPEPFIAALPKRLLSHPKGGALACIGHVERAWGYSIVTPSAGAQLLPFENAIGRMLIGQPIGHAMKDFNERYAALSTSLTSLLEEVSFGSSVSSFELTSAWVCRNDAEGYVILGDPAIRLRVNDLKNTN